MRPYRELLRNLCEHEPGRLASLPRTLVLREASWLLRHDDIYILQQLAVRTDVLTSLNPLELAAARDRALRDCRADDFCFLYGALPHGGDVAPESLAEAYQALAKRGNVTGIEDISKMTGVLPRISEEAARCSYDVLVSTGRLGAADYVRQLSGVPVRFSVEAGRAGLRTLLRAGRYATVTELLRSFPNEPIGELRQDELARAFDRAFAERQLRELAAMVKSSGRSGPVTDFAAHANELLRAGRVAEVPALFALCVDAPTVISPELRARLVAAEDADIFRFLLQFDTDPELRRAYAATAYRIGVQARDRVVVRLACERGGHRLRTNDCTTLLDEAMIDIDPDWIRFASKNLGRLPTLDSDAVQLFLASIVQAEHASLPEMERMLDATLDEPLRLWLAASMDAEFDLADLLVREFGIHLVGADQDWDRTLVQD
ncbi:MULTISPECIES: hypothetical protein [unclassified Nocardia]